MTDAANGKHCDKCQKKVYDFTNSKADEFMKILAENNYSVCGRFNAIQVAPAPTILQQWKRWLSAAMVLVGINLYGCKGNAHQQNIVGDTVSSAPTETTNNQIRVPDIMRPILFKKTLKEKW